MSNVKTTTAQSVVDYLISKETGPDGEPAVLYEDSGEVTTTRMCFTSTSSIPMVM